MEPARPPCSPSPWEEGSPEGRLLRALLARGREHTYLKDPDGNLLMASGSLEAADPAAGFTEVPLRDDRGEIVGILGVSRHDSDHGPADRLHAIIETQRDVASAGLDLESVMQLLCDRTMELTGAEGAAVALLKDGVLRLGASRGSPDHPVGEALSLDQSLGGLAIRDRRSLLCTDALSDPRVNSARVQATGVRSMIAVPLLHAGKPVGTCSS